MPSLKQVEKDMMLAKDTWARYNYGLNKGHLSFQADYKRNHDFYLGDGRHWDEDEKDELDFLGKPYLEANVSWSIINTILGHQTQNRMDISVKPRAIGDENVSESLAKLIKYILDIERYSWKESTVFADGIVGKRGFFDIRMEFDDNLFGEIKIRDLDPMDVIPDPDSSSYDPDDWQDVCISRWYTLDEIEAFFGVDKREEVEKIMDHRMDEDKSNPGHLEEARDTFADDEQVLGYDHDSDIPRVRVIERQWFKLDNRMFWVDTNNGDLIHVPSELSRKQAKAEAKAKGYDLINKAVKRVRWTITTDNVVLHDDWSPYKSFTIIPYFPYFRRGKTIGVMDNIINIQEMIDKVWSQILHFVNSTPNSGWIVEEDSLINMTTESLEDQGDKDNLIIEYSKGSTPPEKIKPNPMPDGLAQIFQTALELMKMVSGISETAQNGGSGPEVTGAAIQSRIQQSAIQMAVPIDNLFKTRYLLGLRMLSLIQQFYTEPRVIRIVEDTLDENGDPIEEDILLNQQDELGNYFNDVSVGKYDIVVADVPSTVTFQDLSFAQAMEMAKFGYPLPAHRVVRLSSLPDKYDIAKEIAGTSPEQQKAEATAARQALEAQEAEIQKTVAETKEKQVKIMSEASDIAEKFMADPALAAVVDSLMQSSEQKAQTDKVPLEDKQESPELPEG